MSEEIDPLIMRNLYYVNGMCCESLLFLEENNIKAPLRHGGGGV